jgi:hypothetical protein
MSHPTNTQVHTSINTSYIHQQESTLRARRAAALIFLVLLMHVEETRELLH